MQKLEQEEQGLWFSPKITKLKRKSKERSIDRTLEE
jgi:hypothetical protein